MGKLIPIKKEIHAGKRWRPLHSYGLFQEQALVPVALGELRVVVSSYPLAFVKIRNHIFLMAVMGFEPNTNLYIGKQGQLLSEYVPVFFRTYPFRVSLNPEGQAVLMIDEEYLSDDSKDIELFKEDGSLAEKTEEMVKTLIAFERDRQITVLACKFLEEKELLEPWPIRVQTPEGVKNVQGLMKVNERKFLEISSEDLVAMRNNMSLAVYYAQFYSMANLTTLAKLYAQRQTEIDEPLRAVETSSSSEEFSDLEKLFKDLKFPKN